MIYILDGRGSTTVWNEAGARIAFEWKAGAIFAIPLNAWHQHFNRPIAEAMAANAQMVGMPAWSEDDQAFARAVQETMGSTRPNGLSTNIGNTLGGPATSFTGGGSDDIGDVAWKQQSADNDQSASAESLFVGIAMGETPSRAAGGHEPAAGKNAGSLLATSHRPPATSSRSCATSNLPSTR